MRSKSAITGILFLLFISLNINAQEPLSNRVAKYNIKAKLNTETKTVDGSMQLEWRNTSTDTLRELQFHLYLNAFKNTKSTFLKEAPYRIEELAYKSDELSWGACDIKSLKMSNGTDLTSKMKFIHSDDDNADDETVVSISLPDTLMPNRVIKLTIEFQSKLPRIIARSGFADFDFFMVSQWFPKIGVYEPAGMRNAKKGRWNCHQYHANSEFYADFATYDVEITLPTKFVVAASALLVKQKENEDKTKTLSFKAEDILDFAWSASPNFEIAEGAWKNVNIKVFADKQHTKQSQRMIDAVTEALNFFDQNIGQYPYTYMNIVVPPFRADAAGGMEYTTLFTSLAVWGTPKNIRLPEFVTIHEFGHSYFMGMLATNEFEEAWLDEGFNSYFEARTMDKIYGENSSLVNFMGLQLGDFEWQRLSYFEHPYLSGSILAQNAWEFKNSTYGAANYGKAAVWLKTLENLVGIETMDQIIKAYFKRWKFKHPTASDFIAIANEIVKESHGARFGKDLSWFFDQMLYSSAICDYKIDRISVNEVPSEGGYFQVNGKRVLAANNNKKSANNYLSKVYVKREGDIIMPVEILVHFNNESEIMERWDGKDYLKVFEYTGPETVQWVVIDPNNKLLIDKNLMNNSKTMQPQQMVMVKYFAKFLFWLQNVMLFFGFFA